jgi:Asp/Glu/hydantoin racemase
MVERTLRAGKRCGILTISAASLTEEHLIKAGCALDTPIGGTPEQGEFSSVILNNQLELDVDKARQENVDAAIALARANPDLGAVVLECTNMIPYAADIRKATGLPVFSSYGFVSWFQQGLQPRADF